MIPIINRLIPHRRSARLETAVLADYIAEAPSEQWELDLFRGEWSSGLPAPLDHLAAGQTPLFQDERIAWLIEQLGDLSGYKCLELGPLEGGHSYMLEQAGARDILAVEANQRAFLKCLIVKNLLNLHTRFRLGSFVPFLEMTAARYDLVLASGVLYHMQEPARVLRLIAQRTDRLFLWTHYFDEKIIRANPTLSAAFGPAETHVDQGQEYTVHKQTYRSRGLGFCGGGTGTTNWMTRSSLLRCLSQQGFRNIQINFEQTDHPNGPSLALLACRGS